MKNLRLGGKPGMTRQDGPDRLFVAVKEKLDVGTAFERDRRGMQDDRRPVIAPHRVQRYANVARHSLSDRPGRVARGAARRDNSGSAAQGNARNYLLVAANIDWAEQMPRDRRNVRDAYRL